MFDFWSTNWPFNINLHSRDVEYTYVILRHWDSVLYVLIIQLKELNLHNMLLENYMNLFTFNGITAISVHNDTNNVSLKGAVFILFLWVIIDVYGSQFCLILMTFVLILTIGLKTIRRQKIRYLPVCMFCL